MTLAREFEPTLSDAEFRAFRKLFRDHCGLHFTEDSRYLLERRLVGRLRELDLGSFAAYHYLLRRDPSGEQELAAVVDELTTNETYFFRECGQLRALVDEIIPTLLERRRRRGSGPVCIWSAGCSSGEEPYSLVVLAQEAGLVPGRDLRVYASDISGRMLQKARRGLYRSASFRETDPSLKKKYFEEVGGLWALSDDVKRHVAFTRINLLDPGRLALLGPMDVVLCRNVLIYFDVETKRQVIESFREKLLPGGFLLLGHAESLINLSNAFELRDVAGDLVYRRPVPGEERSNPWHELAGSALANEVAE